MLFICHSTNEFINNCVLILVICTLLSSAIVFLERVITNNGNKKGLHKMRPCKGKLHEAVQTGKYCHIFKNLHKKYSVNQGTGVYLIRKRNLKTEGKERSKNQSYFTPLIRQGCFRFLE